MATNPFPEWLAEVAADSVVVRPDDVDVEGCRNLWSFSLSPEQAAGVTVDDVCEFAAGVAAGRRAWLTASGAGPLTMYWWHDVQAGQLRFSLVSASHGRLPFGCAVTAAPCLVVVAADWLGQTLAAFGESLPVWSEVLSRE